MSAPSDPMYLWHVGYGRGRSDLANLVRNLANRADEKLDDEHADRQLLLEDLIADIRRATS